MRHAQAVLVLPPAARGRLAGSGLRRWLARGRLDFRAPDREILADVLELLGQPVPSGGLAALRFWGQSAERSGAWMAAADPVHLETRMRDVRLRHVAPGEYQIRELDELVESLQKQLGGDDLFDFMRIGSHAYVRASEPFDGPQFSAAVVDGDVPDNYVPTGPGARLFHRLLGETEMVVHGHQVNARRAAAGKPLLNSFWFWGGGIAPEPAERDLPPLYSGDPLFRGYWASAGAVASDWRGDLGECIDSSAGRFVAVLPDLPPAEGNDALQQVLSNVRVYLHSGDLSGVFMFFRDGLQAKLRRTDRFRVWRRPHGMLEVIDA